MPVKLCPKCGNKNAVARKICLNCANWFFDKRKSANFRLTDALSNSENKENEDGSCKNAVVGYSKSCRPIKRTDFYSKSMDSKVFQFLKRLPEHPKSVKSKQEWIPQSRKPIKWFVAFDGRERRKIKNQERRFFAQVSSSTRQKMDQALSEINRIITKKQPSL